jgi:GTPase SAR1 family protein
MALAPLFFRKAIGALLVFDVTKKESFDQLDLWL